MSGESIVLEATGICKTFKNHNEDLLSNSGAPIKEIFSLSGIDFKLAQGEILGVIGNNGSGKSTLLKIISGLLKPDAGTVTYRGKLSSILDIGSGFHPDLTGIENVHMAARLIGYSKAEIDNMVINIIDFSGLHSFMQTQVKHYSSGMFMRLAFSLFTTVKSDILIIDEVLSVGDMSFKEKSLARIKEIAASGVSIIIASHEIRTIQNLCTHGLLLDEGKKGEFGKIHNIIDKYLEHDIINNVTSFATEESLLQTIIKQKQSTRNDSLFSIEATDKNAITTKDTKIILHHAFIRAVGKPIDADMFMDDEIEVSIEYEKLIDLPIILSAVIADKFGNNLISLCSYRVIDSAKFTNTTASGRYVQSVKIPKGLFNHGMFSVSFYLADELRNEVASFEKLLYFMVHKSELKSGSNEYPVNYSCPLFPIADWETIANPST